MPVTRFPNGIEIGNGTTAGDFTIGGTTQYPVTAVSAATKVAAGTTVVTAGSVSVASGLTTVSFVAASPYGILLSTAGTVGGFVAVTAQNASGGSITLRAYDQMGTAAVANGTASWVAVGT